MKFEVGNSAVPMLEYPIMRKLRIYLDTSVINFLFAQDVPDFRKATEEFFSLHASRYEREQGSTLDGCERRGWIPAYRAFDVAVGGGR